LAERFGNLGSIFRRKVAEEFFVRAYIFGEQLGHEAFALLGE